MIEQSLQPVFDPAEVRQLWKQYVDDPLPAEKAEAKRRGLEIARDLKQEGGHKFDGGGQKMGSVDLKTWIRWNHEFPGCWNDQTFVDEFLWHNRQYCAPGYYPKQPRDFRFIK